jgi:hypothetical protein
MRHPHGPEDDHHDRCQDSRSGRWRIVAQRLTRLHVDYFQEPPAPAPSVPKEAVKFGADLGRAIKRSEMSARKFRQTRA